MAEIMAVLGPSLFTFFDGGRDVARVLDRVAIKHRSGFPSADVHDRGLGNARSTQFPCG